MSERTALEIADSLEVEMLSLKNADAAAEVLRQQHAEIERLTALNSALTEKGNSYVIENARQAEEIARLKTVPMKYRRMAFNAQLQEEIKQLTAERDAAIANASALTHHLAQVIGDHNAPSDCYSSGPMFGDARDAVCPTCAALRFLSYPRASVDSGYGAAIAAAVDAEREARAAEIEPLKRQRHHLYDLSLLIQAGEDGLCTLFNCEADNEADACRQAHEAYPGCRVLTIYTG